MVTVVKKKGQNNETLFREFGRLSANDEFAKLLRERMFYTKPSQVRKEKEKNRKKRRRKTN